MLGTTVASTGREKKGSISFTNACYHACCVRLSGRELIMPRTLIGKNRDGSRFGLSSLRAWQDRLRDAITI